jgi:Flp pilus assembly protein TadB
MTRQRRRRKHRGDSIHDLEEWQNHQYDPGYLSNLGRLRLFSGSHSTARYLLPILGTLLAAILVVPLLEWAGLNSPLVLLLVGLALLTLLVVMLTQPLRALERRSRRRAGRGR